MRTYKLIPKNETARRLMCAYNWFFFKKYSPESSALFEFNTKTRLKWRRDDVIQFGGELRDKIKSKQLLWDYMPLFAIIQVKKGVKK